MTELDIRGILAELTREDAQVLRGLDAQIEGAEEFENEELPDPLDPEALALGGNWVLRTRLGRFDIMQWIGEDELWGKLSPGRDRGGDRQSPSQGREL